MGYAIVNIGSNLGNRRLNLAKAVGAIINRFGEYHASHIVQTEPWGFESPHPFLNMCVMFATDLEPLKLLKELQAMERAVSPASHRNADGAYADRLIDIDLLDYDRKVIESAELTLPHPRLAERRFYLEPLAEIAPGYSHPLTHLTAAEMLSRLLASDTSAAPDA